ncbi:hypothetical protein HPB47_004165 [Ixodes persulcatus]|uniref:Uncharacterized protein n=1 Tax=Ixodes persulcatus TaxID=34615 RepID=A0AC60PGN3_IXOPE|nr:hypothetical protein HPB47_004165 [Ixodes persulcatus]
MSDRNKSRKADVAVFWHGPSPGCFWGCFAVLRPLGASSRLLAGDLGWAIWSPEGAQRPEARVKGLRHGTTRRSQRTLPAVMDCNMGRTSR